MLLSRYRLRMSLVHRLALLAVGLQPFGCEQRQPEQVQPAAQSSDFVSRAATEPLEAELAGEETGRGTASARATTLTAAQPAPCPEGMTRIPGGEYWAGRLSPGGNREEHPKYKTRVHDFCMDRTEVTTEAYESCVTSGRCETAVRDTKTCNSGRQREDHPINCVSYEQAGNFCKARGARLPTELEWEYAARGGNEYREYSWGDAAPDGNTCWKRAHSCPVAAHAEGAFGLHDMNGNVWEWTSTWFAPYPWPAVDGFTKVYRGGSWSRRFEKWMSLTLRNRQAPDEWGSHLGFRCAALPVDAECPYGADGRGGCQHGVEDAECRPGSKWNGARCAREGAAQCPERQRFEPGRGCVGEAGATSPERSSVRSAASDSAEVKARRDQQFDSDCKRFNPKRPLAWRFDGATHAARNLAGNRRGCKNRDVGVGWNSACCPQ